MQMYIQIFRMRLFVMTKNIQILTMEKPMAVALTALFCVHFATVIFSRELVDAGYYRLAVSVYVLSALGILVVGLGLPRW